MYANAVVYWCDLYLDDPILKTTRQESCMARSVLVVRHVLALLVATACCITTPHVVGYIHHRDVLACCTTGDGTASSCLVPTTKDVDWSPRQREVLDPHTREHSRHPLTPVGACLHFPINRLCPSCPGIMAICANCVHSESGQGRNNPLITCVALSHDTCCKGRRATICLNLQGKKMNFQKNIDTYVHI